VSACAEFGSGREADPVVGIDYAVWGGLDSGMDRFHYDAAGKRSQVPAAMQMLCLAKRVKPQWRPFAQPLFMRNRQVEAFAHQIGRMVIDPAILEDRKFGPAFKTASDPYCWRASMQPSR